MIGRFSFGNCQNNFRKGGLWKLTKENLSVNHEAVNSFRFDHYDHLMQTNQTIFFLLNFLSDQIVFLNYF